MNQNLKKMISYYKPYRAVFVADMLFATLSAAVALTIPLVVRYVTSTLIYQQPQMMLRKLFLIGIGLFVLLALDCYSRFFIGNYGHVMGAKMEYDMRAELFGHLQKLSFSFYDDAKVIILSRKAGGTCLNLTSATNVIHYDLRWNPAIEDQATDRTYRIGQDKNVMVHRMITLGTFEEKIDEMLKSKKELADLAVYEGEKIITELSDEEIYEIFTLSG